MAGNYILIDKKQPIGNQNLATLLIFRKFDAALCYQPDQSDMAGINAYRATIRKPEMDKIHGWCLNLFFVRGYDSEDHAGFPDDSESISGRSAFSKTSSIVPAI
jgi:hypothetical protein